MPNTQPDDLLAREITPEDAEAAAQLSEELGYPVSPAEMKQRIEALARLPDHAIYVACVAGTVFGWIDVGICRHLQSEPRAEIGGLVVSSEVRGRGVGFDNLRGELGAATRPSGNGRAFADRARGSSQLLPSGRIRADENLRGIHEDIGKAKPPYNSSSHACRIVGVNSATRR